jgi:hypothetical protein
MIKCYLCRGFMITSSLFTFTLITSPRNCSLRPHVKNDQPQEWHTHFPLWLSHVTAMWCQFPSVALTPLRWSGTMRAVIIHQRGLSEHNVQFNALAGQIQNMAAQKVRFTPLSWYGIWEQQHSELKRKLDHIRNPWTPQRWPWSRVFGC